ncbi:MAG TPA: toll/interleukin-1 receptor domain-containing protein [Candidatus Angelobacter sp.]|nr:toll/interleukin-1 receptor domain-containing protein [Candidatus Angelobacter sp.]
MRAIFISYRRDDAEGEAGRLFSDLSKHFGEDRVFMDVVAIEPGRDFRKVIDQNVASCGVLLAMIGPRWVDAQGANGQRRLDDPSDFVRLETASALRRDIPVIPVLVHEARMPQTEQLPDDLKELCYRNAVQLTHARWDSDLQLLVKALEKCIGTVVTAPAAPAPQAAAAAAAAVPAWTPPPQPPPPPRAPAPVQTPVYQSPPIATQPAPTPAPAGGVVSGGLKVGICLIGLFVAIVPIIMGIIYMMDASPEKKSAGKLWLWVGIGEFVFGCLIWSALMQPGNY